MKLLTKEFFEEFIKEPFSFDAQKFKEGDIIYKLMLEDFYSICISTFDDSNEIYVSGVSHKWKTLVSYIVESLEELKDKITLILNEKGGI